MKKLSIIIVSWNVKDFLKKCLVSIEAGRAGIDLEVFVVDNASGDGSAQLVQQEFPWVKLIANKENILKEFLINDIIEAEKFYDHHKKLVSTCGYLSTLSEDDSLYGLYHDVMHRDHKRTFSDFN